MMTVSLYVMFVNFVRMGLHIHVHILLNNKDNNKKNNINNNKSFHEKQPEHKIK